MRAAALLKRLGAVDRGDLIAIRFPSSSVSTRSEFHVRQITFAVSSNDLAIRVAVEMNQAVADSSPQTAWGTKALALLGDL